MLIFKIVDLPKGYKIWHYYPPRIMFFKVSRAGQVEFKEIKATLVDPLELRVGDRVLFEDEMPKSFRDITKGCSSHPSYAILFKEETQEVERQTSIIPID